MPIDRETLLRQIIKDPNSTPVEIAEAQRELNPPQSPATQAQEDELLENMLRGNFEPNDPRYCDEIVNLWHMLGARMFGPCGDAGHVEILAALYTRTKSALIRENVVREMRHIAEFSPAKTIQHAAVTFLANHNLEQPRSSRNTGATGPCFGCYLRERDR